MGLAILAKVEPAVDPSLKCLVVGLPALASLHDGVATEETGTVRFGDLTAELPLSETVGLVVAPLFCADFDALEMLDVLGRSGYRGTLRVVAPKLPNRQIVLRELRSHAVRQGITLDLVEAG
jgi:hypothetical protein